MIISQLQIAAMNRVHIAKEERRDFFLYVDEFQNFATTSFVKILSEARKFRLNLILTNQYTAQLPEEIQKAIFGNAGTIISFVVSADDANRLIAEMGTTYTQDDLVSLVRYQIVLKLAIDETISPSLPGLYPAPAIFQKPKPRQSYTHQFRTLLSEKFDCQIECKMKLCLPTSEKSNPGSIHRPTASLDSFWFTRQRLVLPKTVIAPSGGLLPNTNTNTNSYVDIA